MDLSRKLEQAESELERQDAALAGLAANDVMQRRDVYVCADRVAELKHLFEPPTGPALPTHFVRI